MKTLWYIPLEHLDKRYTIMMDRQIQNELIKEKIKYKRIYGKILTKTIQTGFFLDAIGTNYFKFSQLMRIMELFQNNEIKNGDVFFFSDLWFPGIEAIKYVTAFKKFDKIKITGVMHAGSWTETDDVRTLMKDWAKNIEIGWFKFIDKVFVGSVYHKNEIVRRKRILNSNKIIVTGLAFDSKEIFNIVKPLPWEKREDIIVFPHRIHWEKQPEVFDKFIKYVEKFGFKGIKTMEQNLSKHKYFELLAKSKFAFSSALQENFGYGMFEATVLGCIPIVPNKLAYKQYYPAGLRYDSLKEAFAIFDEYKYGGYKPVDLKQLDFGVTRIIKNLKEDL